MIVQIGQVKITKLPREGSSADSSFQYMGTSKATPCRQHQGLRRITQDHGRLKVLMWNERPSVDYTTEAGCCESQTANSKQEHGNLRLVRTPNPEP